MNHDQALAHLDPLLEQGPCDLCRAKIEYMACDLCRAKIEYMAARVRAHRDDPELWTVLAQSGYGLCLN